MKKILFAFCLFFSFQFSFAQNVGEYVLSLYVDYLKNIGNGMKGIEHRIYVYKNNVREVLFESLDREFGKNATLPIKETYWKKYTADLLPKEMYFYTRRWWESGGDDQNDNITNVYSVGLPKPVFIGNVPATIFYNSETSIKVTVKPYNFDYWYFDVSGNKPSLSTDAVIPDNHEITIKTNTGFSPETYNWEYSLDISNDQNWKPFPVGIKRSSDGSEITFKGNDISNFDPTAANFSVRINCDSYVGKTSMSLKPCHSAPEIDSVWYDTEKCSGSNGAVIKVRLDRDIKPTELFYLKINQQIHEWRTYAMVDARTVSVDQIKGGIPYLVSLWGGENQEPFYSGDKMHRAEIFVEARPSINFSMPKQSNVSCFGGSDGTITVTASRESEAQFTARLYQSSTGQEIQSIQFANNVEEIFTNLKAGTYEVRLTDENGCNPKTDSGADLAYTVQVDQPSLAVGVGGDIASQEPKGYDTKDGIFSFQIVGGQGGYVVQVVDAQTNLSVPCSIAVDNKNYGIVSGIGRGTYRITVTDQSYDPAFGTTCGCRYDFEYTVTAPDPIVPEVTNHKDALCYSDNNGSVTVTAKGGRPYDQGLYDYLWYRTGESTAFFNDSKKIASTYNLLTAGDYKVVILDKNTIKAELEFTVSEPNPVMANYLTNNISCYGGLDGSLAVVAQGGSGQYKGQLIGGENYSKELTFDTQTSAEFTGLAVGNYYLYLTDANGCPMRDKSDASKVVEYYEIVITEPKKPVKIERVDTQLPISHQSADGVAVVQVWGGTTQDGAYQVVAKSVERGRVYSPSASVPNGVYTEYTFTGLQAGRYVIEASDSKYTNPSESACGCIDRVEIEFTAPAPMEVVLKELKKVSCYGSNTAQVVAHAYGGTRFTGSPMPYKYQWSQMNRGVSQAIDAASDSIALNLSAGSYRVEVFDAKGVSVTSDILTVGEPDSLSVSFEITDIDCSGANTGSIKATVKGGMAPYAYQWNISGQNTPNISNLEMGIYTFKVTDSNGCNKVAQVEVKSAVEITVDSIIVQPNCLRPNGGSIKLNLSGGSAPYVARWSDNNSSQLKREQLPAGTYRVAITDNKGCKVPYSFTLHEPHSFTIALPEDFTMCRNQSRTIKAECKEPKVLYRWYCDDVELPSDGGNSITASKAGVYRVVATNEAGCTAQDELVVAVSSESLNLEMIAPTKVAVGTEIHAVNLSTVSAQSLIWSLPQEAILLKKNDTEVVFVLDKAGFYPIALQGDKNGCSTIVTRTVEVVGIGDEQLPNDKKSLIKQFLVSPNPTKDYFKVMVELVQADDFTMKLYSPSGVLVDEKKGVNVHNKSFEYEINGSIEGTYLLHLITRYDKAVLQVVVKH